MEKLTIDEIIKSTKGEILKNNASSLIEKIVIDNREVEDNSLFIPIIGEVHDGHKFMEASYNASCRNFLIDKNHEFLKDDINLIKVDNTTQALGDIAKYYCNKFSIPKIAITGSVGKTSTKDIIYSVLSSKYETLKNEGNLNNNIGLPKTVFGLNKKHEIGIFEMGMENKGEISYLANIVMPDIAVISNIGMSHIENFDSQKDIFEAKMEIADYFNEKSILIVNGDDEFLKTLREEKHDYQLLTYGFSTYNDIYCSFFEVKEEAIEFICNVFGESFQFVIPSTAKHNIYNAMSAILVGIKVGMSLEEIKEGLRNFSLTPGRLTIIKKEKLTIIDDAYNASADSMIAALGVLKPYKQRRVAVLGDILATGKYTEYIHRLVGKEIKGTTDILITVGSSSKFMVDEALKAGFDKDNIYSFENYEEALNDIKNIIKKEDVVLVKASHGINLQKIVEYLNNEY